MKNWANELLNEYEAGRKELYIMKDFEIPNRIN